MSLNKTYNYNIGSMDINVTGITTGTINASGLSTLTNVTAANISTGTIQTASINISGLVSGANLSCNFSTVQNILNTNISSGAIQTASINISSLVSGANLSAITATVPNMMNTNISTGTIQTASINISGLVSGANLSSNFSTVQNILNTNISSGAIQTASINISSLVSGANLSAIIATIPNIMNTNISSGTINLSTGITTSLARITNINSTTVSTGTLLANTITGSNLSLSGDIIIGGTLTTVNITSVNVVDTNISAGSLNATTSTIPNIIHTNISTGTINASGGITTSNINITGSFEIPNVSAAGNSNTIGNLYTTGGNVGIGTHSPRTNLEISQSSSTTGVMLYSGINDGGVNNLIFCHTDNASTWRKVAIQSQALGTHARANLGLCVNTVADNSNVTMSDAKLFISGSSGNVGVGTDSPRTNLEISQSSSTTGVMLYSGINDGGVNNLIFCHTDNASTWRKVAIQSQALGTHARANLGLCVNTVADNSNVTMSDAKLFISGSSGNVGVGTDSPAYPLHVNGTLNAKDIIINANTNNLYVAVAYNSSIAATSTDGVTWTQRSLPASANWISVTVNTVTGVFVAVAHNNLIAASSTDGITWTQRSLPVSANWYSVTVNPNTGVFVAVASSSSIAASSTDGITWTQRSLPVYASWESVTVNPKTGVFVAFASGNPIVATSTDGITWTQRSLPTATGCSSVTVNEKTGVFVGLVYNTSIAVTSTDGITWTQRSLPVSASWTSVTVNPVTDIFVAIATSSSIAATSTDGITWTQRSLPVYASWTSVTVNPVTGIFVAVAYYNSSIAATSTDGITWTQRSLPVSANWNSVTVKGTNNLVSIGTSTPHPYYQLHAVSTTSLPAICAQSNAQFANLSINNYSVNGREYYAGSDNSGCFYIYDNTASAFRMTINNSGFVGIATTSPGNCLQVKGCFKADSHTTSINNGWIYLGVDGRIEVGGGNTWLFGGNGTLYGPGPYQNNSDSRIKENIVDVDDTSALNILRQIQPKRYNYVDRQNKGDSPVWGFIAQQIAGVLDYAVDTITQFIPNIYEQTGVASDNHTITLNEKTTTGLTVGMRIKLIKTDKSSIETWITGIVDNKNFTVECDLTDIKHEDQIFVYGIQVDDFHSLNKDAIFTIATAALQEVDRELQAEKEKTQTLENELGQLKQFIQSKFPGELL